jgi:molybdate transport system regulatory protein
MGFQRSRSRRRELSVGLRCWIECNGHVLIGRGRAQLLDEIARLRSISAAARAMKMSYRRAWILVQSMNDAAGEPLVLTAAGGRHGGGAELTARGRDILAIFRRLDNDLLGAAVRSLPNAGKSGLATRSLPTSKTTGRRVSVRRVRKPR